jgi:uncharacterized protein YgiM (DUF1202 family)
MANLKMKIKRPTASTFKGWTFVVVAGLLLAAIAVIDRGGLSSLSGAADGSTGCVLSVSVPELNVRSAASQDSSVVQTLAAGEKVDGTRVLQSGFRQLKDGYWAWDQYMTPLTGTNCA